jgi:Uma2 family endonuclease
MTRAEVHPMNAPYLPLREASDGLGLEPAMPEEPVLPLSVEAYHALLKAGILQDGDPIELLEGFLVRKMTKGPRHAAAKRRFLRLLGPLVPPSHFVDSQEAMTAPSSEPEPDVYVVRGPESDFTERHPGPGEVEIVVEIADSSLHRDRGWKKRVYARAGVPCYWVVNLADDCIEVFAQPSGPTKSPSYSQSAVYRAGDDVPVVIDGKEVGRIAAEAILGERKVQP